MRLEGTLGSIESAPRSLIAATLAELRGVQEGGPSGERRASALVVALETQPILAKAARFIAAGLGTRDELLELLRFRAEREAAWGAPVSSLDLGQLRGGELFAVRKAIALTRLRRTPADVTEVLIDAAGSVRGLPIAPRQIFVQRWRPVGRPTGRVVGFAPNYPETAEPFYEQIHQINERGHDVIAMHQQWAGMSEGRPGAVDRGFGVARDVAAVAAWAEAMRRAEYGDVPGSRVVLYGHGMSAGPGVLSALVLEANGALELDGQEMPAGLSALLLSPFFGPTPGALSNLLAALGRLPVVNRIAAPHVGEGAAVDRDEPAPVPRPSASLDDVRVRLQAMRAVEEDLAAVRTLLETGRRPSGQVQILHQERDALADPQLTAEWARLTGGAMKPLSDGTQGPLAALEGLL